MRYMFCIDFSECAEKAFNIGSKLINPSTDDVILFCACETYKHDVLNTLRVDFDYQILSEANQNIVQDTKELINEFRDKLVNKFGDALKIKSIVLPSGDPKTLICKTIQDEKVDSLIMGSRGLGKMKKMVVGSVSDYCLRNAKCKDIIIIH